MVRVRPVTLTKNNLRAFLNSEINMSAPKAPINRETAGELRKSVSGILDELDQNTTTIRWVSEIDQAACRANSRCVIEHPNPTSANMGGY